MAEQEQTAKVTLDLSLGSGGYRLMDDLKTSISKASAFAKTLADETRKAASASRGFNWGKATAAGPGDTAAQEAQARGFFGRLLYGTPQVDKAGKVTGSTGGLIPGIGAGALRFAGGLAAVGAITGAATTAANYGYDPYQTSGQAGRALFRNVVPFGGTIQSFADSLSGRKIGMELADVEASKLRERFSGQLQRSAFELGYNPVQAGRTERQRQLDTGSPIVLGPIDRSSATGEREFREQSRLLGARRELARLERESAVATKERFATETELGKVATRENDLIRKRGELERAIARDSGSGVERQQLLTRFRETSEALTGTAQLRREAEQRAVESRIRESEARGGVRRGRAQLAEDRAANLEERATSAAGTARTLGGLNVFDRDFGVASLKALQQFGPEALPPEMLAAAQQIAPQTSGKILEKSGAAFAQRAGLAEIAPADFAGDPEKLRREAQAARDEAERERFGAEQDVARGTASAGAKLADAVIRAIDRTVDEAIKRIDNNKRIERNSP